MLTFADSKSTVRFTAKVNGKSNPLNFDIHEDGNDDSGIGMSLLSNHTYEFANE